MVAVVERFIRTMKNEWARKTKIPLHRDVVRQELIFYLAWYNKYRPHTYLHGRTPQEVYGGLVPANAKLASNHARTGRVVAHVLYLNQTSKEKQA
jgi:hypothetical protein